MIRYARLNTVFGWACFVIASATYLLTKEASASWWDCGEFLSAAYKLEVVHEPGSPLFLMIGKLFSLLAMDRSHVALCINASSALASGATILFLFWTITALAQKLIIGATGDYRIGNVVAILGSGLVGALAYAWSDTFWFSAVESEVYAMSSLCTALVFWAILKWENHAGEPRADKWIIFIAYVMGLSIGVHLLNLLTIPAITFVYYFKRYPATTRGVVLASVISVGLVAVILFGIIPGVISLAADADIYAVNSLHFGFDVGASIFLILLAAAIAGGIYYAQTRRKTLLNLALLGTAFILIGYASYAMVIIRANANPPLNNSNPDNFVSLLGYLGREQYEESPLLYGQRFTSRIVDVKEGGKKYRKGTTRYEAAGNKSTYVYDEGTTMPFPRIWDAGHAREYRAWLGLSDDQKPTWGDNLKFFWEYQLGYMYWRYFMWNFAGRQNDIPSAFPNATRGNWISGIGFVDALRLGNQRQLPPSITTNKAYNRLFFLPLLLGLVGFLFQLKKSPKDFTIVALLFVFTGIAIAVYLNMPPSQPRERDYAFAGSFYAFAIWIGLGVLWLYHQGKKFIKPLSAAVAITGVCLAAVPLLMLCQEYNDHDRSQRLATRDFAANYLNSCAPNAILFTYGDNETYPLWYAQEVENIRTDIRVINLSLFDASWCIDKMKLPMNRSAPLPITLQHNQYVDGVRDYIEYKDAGIKGPVALKDVVDFVASDDPQTRLNSGENYLPTKHFTLPVDAQQALGTHTVDALEKRHIVTSIDWTYNKNSLSKGQMILLDILAHNNWSRPIYFCATMGSESYLGLDDYLRQEGITYRLVPLKRDSVLGKSSYPVNIPVMYENVMGKYRWGNLNKGIHVDDQTNSFAGSFKETFIQLAESLLKNHQKDSCYAVLQRCSQQIPSLPAAENGLGEDDYLNVRMAEMYYECGATDKGNALLKKQLNAIKNEVAYVISQGSDINALKPFGGVIQESIELLESMLKITGGHGGRVMFNAVNKELNSEKSTFQIIFKQ